MLRSNWGSKLTELLHEVRTASTFFCGAVIDLKKEGAVSLVNLLSDLAFSEPVMLDDLRSPNDSRSFMHFRFAMLGLSASS